MIKHFPDWKERINVVVQLSFTRHPDLPNVPLIFDYLKSEFMKPGVTVEEGEKLWRIMLVQKAMGRPFAVGPGVPPDRVKALRDAFHAALADREFLAEAEKTQNEINPIVGDELQQMLQIVG